MKNGLKNHIKNLLLPCLGFSIAAGFLSAILATAFKLAAEVVIHISNVLYGKVAADLRLLALLVFGSAAVGLIASLILSRSRSCRGGGIPTSVAAIRGIVSFRWLASIFVLPFSALLTFLCGIPLGTEGPCVQMGTAVGDGVIKCFGKKRHGGWRRYVMTGGASAGFSVATGAPISSVLFSIEELHKHFSPMLLTVASVSVITSQITVHLLSMLGIGSARLFHLAAIDAISPKLLFAPLVVGLVCGACSILFTRLYNVIDSLMRKALQKISIKVLFPILFACVAVVGAMLSYTLGTGHSLVDTLLRTQVVWYVLILVFLIRAIFMMVANTAGVSGGVFLPTLAFGAIVGSLCGEAMIAFGWIQPRHYILMVILGITSFLGSTSRIPVTACVFAVEALGGINNILPIIISTTVALLVVELSGLEDFTDTVIEAKVHALNKGQKPTVVEVPLTVARDSFAVGKEPKDILWPNSCVVVSFERAAETRHVIGICEGDIITVHYKTYHPDVTAEELAELVGEQSEQVKSIMLQNNV